MSKLHLLSGGNVVATVELTGELIFIGRTEDKGLCIEDDSISKDHGIFVRDGDEYQIHDFNSTNGTWVNGERIMAVKLKHSDLVRIGHVEVRYDSAMAPAGPKLKLGTGAKLVDHPTAPPAESVSPAPPPSVEPPKPVRRTLGGKPLGASRETAATQPAKPTPPVENKKTSEDRVFIRIPDLPEPPAFTPPPIQEPEPMPEPASSIEYNLTPIPEGLLDGAPVSQESETTQETSMYEPAPEPAAEEALPAAEISLASPPANEAVERKLQTTTASSKGHVSLRQTPAAGGGERKLSLKPSGNTPRDQLRFGPSKKKE
jgi:hypothetical protein